jgi:hypothetical protein
MLFHGFCLSLVREGADLHVEEFVSCSGPDSRVEAAFAQRAGENFSVFLPADRGDLHHDGMARDDGTIPRGLRQGRHDASVRLVRQRRAMRVGTSIERGIGCC